MTLPTSGFISASMINVELGRAAGAPFSINGAAERALAGVPSGPIMFSNFYGKSSGPAYGTGTMVAQNGTYTDPLDRAVPAVGFGKAGSRFPAGNGSGTWAGQEVECLVYFNFAGANPNQQIVLYTVSGALPSTNLRIYDGAGTVLASMTGGTPISIAPGSSYVWWPAGLVFVAGQTYYWESF